MTAVYKIRDVYQVLRTLPDASADLVLTSPPFLAQRSYLPSDHPDKPLEMGSESTPGEFVDALLAVIEECRRVLAPHGSLCVELGDTYAGSGGAGGDYGSGGLRAGQERFDGSARRGPARVHHAGMPSIPGRRYYTVAKAGDAWPEDKSLCLIPELVRVALVYGRNPLTGRETPPWRARNVVRWHRPNPPVGDLGDKFRPSTSDLLVACTAKDRYFDSEAVREVGSPNTHARTPRGVESRKNTGKSAADDRRGGNFSTLAVLHGTSGAPPLDTWTIPTYSYSGAHYAAWPPALCVRPVKAMCPRRVCTICGEPSRRVVRTERANEPDDRTRRTKASEYRLNGADQAPEAGWEMRRTTIGWTDCGHHPGVWTEGWTDRLETVHRLERRRSKLDRHSRALRALDDEIETRWDDLAHYYHGPADGWHEEPGWRSGVVLDPFAGSGVTGLVATGHGRDFVGIDLDERNAELARQRIGPLFLSVEHHLAREAV